MKTNLTYRIERNTDGYRNSESTHRLYVFAGGICEGVICGDFRTLKMMGETWAAVGMYYLLPYVIQFDLPPRARQTDAAGGSNQNETI